MCVNYISYANGDTYIRDQYPIHLCLYSIAYMFSLWIYGCIGIIYLLYISFVNTARTMSLLSLHDVTEFYLMVVCSFQNDNRVSSPQQIVEKVLKNNRMDLNPSQQEILKRLVLVETRSDVMYSTLYHVPCDGYPILNVNPSHL